MTHGTEPCKDAEQQRPHPKTPSNVNTSDRWDLFTFHNNSAVGSADQAQFCECVCSLVRGVELLLLQRLSNELSSLSAEQASTSFKGFLFMHLFLKHRFRSAAISNHLVDTIASSWSALRLSQPLCESLHIPGARLLKIPCSPTSTDNVVILININSMNYINNCIIKCPDLILSHSCY